METSINHVRRYRKAAGLTQKQLAELAGTSQQQVQRIESGAIATNLELASAVSLALGQELKRVFPKAGRTLEKLSTVSHVTELSDDELNEASKDGIELDPRIWRLKVLFKGHVAPMCMPLNAVSYRRLRNYLEDERSSGFVGIDGGGWDAYLRLSQVSSAHLLFDARFDRLLSKWEGPDHEPEDPEDSVEVYFCGQSTPLKFSVHIDDPDDDGIGQIGNVGFLLELGADHERVRFTDIDGEDVWLRTEDIAMFRFKSWIVAPGIDVEDEDRDEGT